MKKIFASQVTLGMNLPCDVYNEKGVLLWTEGSTVKTEQQAQKLINEGYRSDLQEWIPQKTGSKTISDAPDKKDVPVEIKKTFIYSTVQDALLEIQLPLIYILSVFKTDSFFKEKQPLTNQINSIIDVILDICDKHPDEAIATVHMHRQGKYSILNALDKAIVASLCCKALKLSDKDTRSIAAAALTASASVVKLTDIIVNQSKITQTQIDELNEAPANSLLLLTRCGVRDEVWLDSVYMQKEKLNGAGVPRGLKANDISIGARILGIADKYISYILPIHSLKQSYNPAAALKRLFKRNRAILDEKIMLSFIEQCGLIPPGTFVTLKDGGIGIVIKQGKEKTKPVVTKVGDDLTQLYSEFNRTTTLPIEEIIRPPNDIPKKLFKLWSIYNKNNIK